MFKSILLPIDLSDEHSWEKPLKAALKLAETSAGQLHILTVVPDFGMSVVGSFFSESFEGEVLHKVGEDLSAWVNKHVPEGIDVHPHIMHGRVYDQIMSAADKLSIDAIVMGAHAPGLGDYLLGPNAARVVRHAKQSVFVVRG